MSIAEQVGSMCMFGFHGCSLNDPQTREDVNELKANHIKGVILFDHDIAGNHKRNIHNPDQLRTLIADLRNELGADLIVAIDQEGGAVARLDAHNGFLPTVSAAEFSSMIEMDRVHYANKHAKQMASVGIDLNFAPCVDLAIEPYSPIITGRERSLGRDVDRVFRNAQIIIEAHRSFGVRCCIKHYPGHGSALLDSHLGVCDITQTHVDDEIKIFKSLIEVNGNRVAVMSGHLMDSRIDDKFPASLSKTHTTDILRSNLGFDGVIVTDSLDMRAIRDRFGQTDACIHAINAGVDLLLDGANAPGYLEPDGPTRVCHAIIEALESGIIVGGYDRIAESRSRITQFIENIKSTR